MKNKKRKNRSLLPYITIFLLGLGMLFGYLVLNRQRATIAEVGTAKNSKTASVVPGGKTFAFINNPRQDLTDVQAEYLANNYDVVVIGYQSDPMIASAKKIKSYNPNVKLLLYFPTTVRQIGAKYGVDQFKESWYLHDLSSGQRIVKGAAESLERVDLTQTDYTDWARKTLSGFLQQVEFEGVVFDNANPIGLTTDRGSWIQSIGEAKLDAWNDSLIKYLRGMTSMLNQNGQILIYNGIHRTDVKVNRSTDLLNSTNGALNERFCYGQDSAKGWAYGILPKDQQVEDINLQISIARNGQYVLQKVNWENIGNTLDQTERDKYGNYCYGIFLMGHTPGLTFFKFGTGYNLAREPEEYRIQAPATKIDLGAPVGAYKNDDGLLTRQFDNASVVVNLNSSPKIWKNPLSQETMTIPPQQARFIQVNQQPPTPVVSAEPQSASCRTYCREQKNYGNGWCAKQSKNCALNGGVHYPQADNKCSTGLSCCCRN